jgi:hypothetical protein
MVFSLTDIKMTSESENVECDSANPSKPCNPYANFMTNPIASYAYDRFHLSCDEFPFGELCPHSLSSLGQRLPVFSGFGSRW